MVTDNILVSFFCMWLPKFHSSIYWRGFLFSIECFCLLKIICPYIQGFVSGLSFLFHWSVRLFFCQYHVIFLSLLGLNCLQFNIIHVSVMHSAPPQFIGLKLWGWERVWFLREEIEPQSRKRKKSGCEMN